jgi:hypothetical protein
MTPSADWVTDLSGSTHFGPQSMLVWGGFAVAHMYSQPSLGTKVALLRDIKQIQTSKESTCGFYNYTMRSGRWRLWIVTRKGISDGQAPDQTWRAT